MKLHSAKMERELRRRVRSEIKRSPELKREAKQRRKSYSVPPMAIFGLIAMIFVIRIMSDLGKLDGLRAQLVCVTLLSFFLAIWIVTRLMVALYASPDLEALFHNPINDADVFRRQWRVFIRKSAGSVFAFLPLFGCVGLFAQYDLWGWLGLLLLIILQWWVCVITAVWMMFRFPGFPYGAVLGIVGVALFLSVVAHKFVSPIVVSFATKLADIPYWVIPTGWLTLVIESFHSKNYLMAVGAFALVAAYTYSLQFALAGLRDNYRLAEAPEVASNDFSAADHEDLPQKDAVGPAYSMGPTEIEDDIRERIFLKEADAKGLPRIEQLLMRGFNARQRMIAEFAMAETGWSARWRKAAMIITVLVIVTMLVRNLPWRPSIILYFIGTYILGARFLSISNPLGRIFNPSFFSGTNVPWYSGFPLTYHELSNIIIKLNCMRLLLFAPLILVYGVATAILYNYGWQNGLEITAKAICLLFIAQPAIVIFFFSSGTNDTSRAGCLGLLTVLVIGLGAAVLFLGLGAAALFLENDWHGLLCGLGAGVVSLGSHRAYGWAFNRGRFDLMQVPKQT